MPSGNGKLLVVSLAERGGQIYGINCIDLSVGVKMETLNINKLTPAIVGEFRHGIAEKGVSAIWGYPVVNFETKTIGYVREGETLNFYTVVATWDEPRETMTYLVSDPFGGLGRVSLEKLLGLAETGGLTNGVVVRQNGKPAYIRATRGTFAEFSSNRDLGGTPVAFDATDMM